MALDLSAPEHVVHLLCSAAIRGKSPAKIAKVVGRWEAEAAEMEARSRRLAAVVPLRANGEMMTAREERGACLEAAKTLRTYATAVRKAYMGERR